MSSNQKSNLTTIFNAAVYIFTGLQAMVPTMPLTPTGATWVSVIAMFAVSILTAWRQYVSEKIDNKATYATLFVALIATMGGLNELINAIDIPEKTGQWVRFTITFLTMVLNGLSKTIFPEKDGNN